MDVMVRAQKARPPEDFFRTPPEATEALLTLIQPKVVWEPACGDGAISRVLKRHGIDVASSDLVNRGYGLPDYDFLKTDYLVRPTIITNPPFKHAEAFARHAIGLGAETVALLLKATFWNAAIRFPLFMQHPPWIVAPLTWRLDFTNQGAPVMDCAWVIWQGVVEHTEFMPLLKPKLGPTYGWDDDLVALLG